MNKEWHEVIGDNEPAELDMTSSPTTVYQRRNIQQDVIENTGPDGGTTAVGCWRYEERELTPEEYSATKTTEQIMQAVSDVEVNLTMAMIEGGTA